MQNTFHQEFLSMSEIYDMCTTHSLKKFQTRKDFYQYLAGIFVRITQSDEYVNPNI